MTPPNDQPFAADADMPAESSAVSSCPEASSKGTTAEISDRSRGFRRVGVLNVLVHRRDFVAASKSRRQACPSMIVQGRARSDDDGPTRVGFTCSKKIGNAVARNRAKRRLREAARAILPGLGQAGWDYVIIGRKDITAQRPFEDLVRDLEHAIKRLHAGHNAKTRKRSHDHARENGKEA